MEYKQNLGRFISFILRHKPDAIDIQLDKYGWAKVNELIHGINKYTNYNINIDELKLVVNTDSKRRFSFNTDLTLIRANQGHSINVDLQLIPTVPPTILYHGTAEKYKDSIELNGIVSKSRMYVHLSDNIETAREVGNRHGKPLVYEVDAFRMVQNGNIFYLSENGVWLTSKVDNTYIKLYND